MQFKYKYPSDYNKCSLQPFLMLFEWKQKRWFHFGRKIYLTFRPCNAATNSFIICVICFSVHYHPNIWLAQRCNQPNTIHTMKIVLPELEWILQLNQTALLFLLHIQQNISDIKSLVIPSLGWINVIATLFLTPLICAVSQIRAHIYYIYKMAIQSRRVRNFGFFSDWVVQFTGLLCKSNILHQNPKKLLEIKNE